MIWENIIVISHENLHFYIKRMSSLMKVCVHFIVKSRCSLLIIAFPHALTSGSVIIVRERITFEVTGYIYEVGIYKQEHKCIASMYDDWKLVQ